MQNTPDEFDDILNIFQAESSELLRKLGDYTMTLEQNTEKTEVLSLMFQTLHSLKGSARMLGFTELQDIAHHLEDILTLLKTKKRAIDSKLFELFYSSFDILQTGINACVEAKENKPLPEESEILAKLDEYINGPNETKVSNENVDNILVEYVRDKSSEVNAYILELFVLFKKCEEHKIESVSEAFMILSDVSKQLSSFFVETDFEQIKTALNLFSYSCNIDEDDKNLTTLNKCKEVVYSLKDEINNLYQSLGLDCLISEDVSDIGGEEKIEKDENGEPLSKHDSETAEILKLLDANLLRLKESNEPIMTILNLIHKFLVMDITENVSAIMQKMSEMLNLLIEKHIEPDMSVVTIFLYCFNVIKKSFAQQIPLTKEDTALCIEKLSLIEKIFSISTDTAPDEKKEEGEKVINAEVVEPVKPIVKQQKQGDLQNFFKIFENEEIKTLRVDTVKLDKLVSQTGELIINVIKTQEHLSVIEKLNSKLSDCYSESKKILNFLKYFDKRIMMNNNYDDVVVNFYKKVFSYFYENSTRISELQTDTNYLFKKVLEDDTKLNQVIMEVENISKNIRVLPLATVFHMFPRMVRDIAKTANKEIDLIIRGSDTAVDKKIIEEIKTPLIHILRNSIDHGIELPEEREKKGKPRSGKILLSAAQDKNSIIITIEDDGVGINVQKIRQKALERQLLTKEEIDAMSDEQMTGLIFWPGFSTGDKITEISGRGIGLDVVQTKLAQLNGKVNVVSVMDKGCKVIIELPITMSTTKVFVISFGEQFFAIPMATIKLVQWIKPSDIFSKDGKDCILFEEHSIPVFDMAKVLNVKSSYKNKNDNLTLIVTEVENTTVAFIVERLLGDQEILNKKLSLPIYKLKNIGGITALPSGDICLVLNMNEVVRNSLASNSHTTYLEQLHNLAIGRVEDDFNPKEKLISIFDSSGKLLDYLYKCLKYFGYNVNVFTDKDTMLSSILKVKPNLVISNFEENAQQEKDLLYKIKGDENLSDIKLMLVSTCSENQISKIMPDITSPIVVEKTDYNEEEFLNNVEKILR
ncbi:chemotaxis protein CheA [bacterium]|nr:chemotaxis protein CheA [bacterium]